MKVLRLIALSLLCLLLGAVPADAAPVAGLLATIGAAFKAAATIKVLATAALRLVVTIGVSRLLQKYNQRKQKRAGTQTTQTTSGGTDPQGTIVGLFATGGHLAYYNSHGSNRSTLTYLIELSDLPGVALKRLIVDGEYSDLEPIPGGDWQAIATKRVNGADRARIKVLDGSQTEADPDLVTWYGSDPDRPWTTDHKLSGVVYAIIECDRDDKAFPGGRPEFRFELEGVPLYDPRKDDSVGGTGSQRWNTPSTWASTRNPCVIAYNIKRGITLPCGSVWGGGFGFDALPLASWVPAMETCDLVIEEANRPQFEIGFEIRFEEPPADILEEIYSSINAQVVELAGVWTIQVGTPSVPVAHITDDSSLVSSPQSFDPFPGLEKTHNAVTISHTSPGALWNGAALDTQLFPEFEAEDGTQRVFELQLPMVHLAEQARQIGDALIRDNRRFRRHKHVLPPEFFDLDVLNTLSWSSAWNSYSNKEFEIAEIAYDLRTFRTTVSLKEVDPSDFDPVLDLELPDAPRSYVSPVTIDAGVPGFAAAAFVLKDTIGRPRRPAILVSWDPVIAPTVTGLALQMRVQGKTDFAWSGTTAEVARGSYILTDVLPGTTYELTAKALAPDRETNWEPWISVTTDDLRLTADDFDETVNDAIGNALARADAAFEKHDETVEDVTALVGGLHDEIETAIGSLDATTPLEDRIETAIGSLSAEVPFQERIERAFGPLDVETPLIERLEAQIVRLDFEVPQIRQSADEMSGVWETLIDLQAARGESDLLLARAGIRIDEATGTVEISGLHAANDRISQVSLRTDALNASISQKASVAYVNEKISLALLDPTQIPLVDDLRLRIGSVETTLEAETGRIDNLASLFTVAGQQISMVSVTSRLDAAEQALTQRVTSSDFDAQTARINGVETVLTTLGDVSKIQQTATASRSLAQGLDDSVERSIADTWDAYQDRQAIRHSEAAARQELRAQVDDRFVSEAAQRLELKAQTEATSALLTSETKVRATANEATAQSLEQLQAELDATNEQASATADALEEVTTSVSETDGKLSAESERREVLGATVRGLTGADDDSAEEDIAALWDAEEKAADARAQIALSAKNLHTTVEEGRKADAKDRAFLGAQLEDTRAALSTERQTRATKDAALAQDLRTLRSGLGTAEDGISAQVEVTDGLITRVEQTEDGVTGLGQRATTLEGKASDLEEGLEAASTATDTLSQKVTQTEDALTAEADRTEVLGATVRDLTGADDASLEQAIIDLWNAEEKAADARAQIALSAKNLHTTVEEGRKTEATDRALLGARLEDTRAALSTERRTRATKDAALAQDLRTLRADLGSAEDGISAQVEATDGLITRVDETEDGIEALGQRATTLEGKASDLEEGLEAASTATDTLSQTVTKTEETLIAEADRTEVLGATVRDLTGADDASLERAIIDLWNAEEKAADARAQIALSAKNLHTTVEEGRKTEATDRALLGARLEDTRAALSTERRTRATKDAALAQDVRTLRADLGSAEDGISAQAEATDGLITRVDETEDGIEALGQRSTTLETRAQDLEKQTEATGTAVENLTTKTTNHEDGLTSLASKTQVLEAAIRGGQILPNGDLASGDFRGWENVPATFAVVARSSGPSALQDAPTGFVIQIAPDAAPQRAAPVKNVPVHSGEQFRASLMAAADDALLVLRFQFNDASGAYLSAQERPVTLTGGAWRSVDLDPVIAPIGAAQMWIYLRRNAGGSGPALAADLRVERVTLAQADALAKIEELAASKVNAEGALAAVNQQISATFNGLSAMAEATAFAHALSEKVSAGYLWRLQGEDVLELVSVDTGTGGPKVTAKISADYVRITGLAQFDEIVLEQIAAAQAFIGNLRVTNAQIEGDISSVNYAEEDGVPTAGWKLDRDTGTLRAAGGVITRRLAIAEGSFDPGVILVNPNLPLHEVMRWDMVDTGVPLPSGQVWMPAEKTYLASIAFNGGATAPGGITGHNEYWFATATVLPVTRWSGTSSLALRIALEAKGISALHASGSASASGRIHWTLYEVS